ncbi:acyltransferase [Pseudomonas veronii]|uniref:acyltransferase n=1 Tax=Pseudomonas veronii TaxID=76761 RepID=UPI000F846A62|nr:acyltransferase [Pseudomonas veronii]RTY67261.1 acyltransferase [Pseudomonas veronii]
MAFIPEEKLKKMGFKSLGNNVKISDKAAIYNCDQISIGDHTRIDDFCVISGSVTFGRNVHIAIFCNVAGGEPGVTMEDFSGLAYGCQVFAQSDDYSGMTLTNPTVPAAYKKEAKSAIRIGRHVIIGTSSLVLPGVDLADGCSVGALSMVTKSTEPWGIYFGAPAKRIKNRKKDLLELEAAYLASER